jgi:hypothetical protein
MSKYPIRRIVCTWALILGTVACTAARRSGPASTAHNGTSVGTPYANPCVSVPASVPDASRLKAVERAFLQRTRGWPYRNRVTYIAMIDGSVIGLWETGNAGADYFLAQPYELYEALKAGGIRHVETFHLEVRCIGVLSFSGDQFNHWVAENSNACPWPAVNWERFADEPRPN